jgi:signal transduction histidine kinase
MRRMLGILREADSGPALTPQPGIANLQMLLAQVRESGLPVELEVRGDPQPLPPGIDLSAYRIVQEALTNTLKHGGPSAAARVIVGYGPEELVIEVVDEGRPNVGLPPVRGGHGLLGMHERVSFHHGRFRAGPAEHGDGFTVAATFPLTAGPP